MIYGLMKISVNKIFDFFYCFFFLLFLSFASWIQFLAVDHVYPEYDIWTQFVSDTLAKCMITDALHNSHPIEMPIKKPSEINEIFDDITYEKGFFVFENYIFFSNQKNGLFRFECYSFSSFIYW
jgi:hypothetical protein